MQDDLNNFKPEFQFVIDGLRGKGISGYFQQPNQLVLSLQRGPAWPDRGNSFWICYMAKVWHICTWAPRYYRIEDSSRLLEFCENFVRIGDSAQFVVPTDFIARFGLTEVDNEQFEELWRLAESGN